MSSRKQYYLSALRQRLRKFYIEIRDYDKKSPGLYAGIEAFMESGLLLEVVSSKELEYVIDEQHYAVFGFSLSERQFTDIVTAHRTGNYSILDTPAWTRHSKKAR